MQSAAVTAKQEVVVTLTGKVGSAAERQQALSLAKSTDGVKQVIDKLTIGTIALSSQPG